MTKKKPLSKEAKAALTKKAREDNIAEFEKRKKVKVKPPEVPKIKEKELTADEIRKKLRRGIQPERIIAAKKPYYILKPMKKLLAEQDMEIVEVLAQSYTAESARKLKEKGDLAQKNLYFTNVRDCPREIYYKFFEPQRARDYTVKGQILFDDGNIHHRTIQRRLEDMGKAKRSEGYLNIPEVEAGGYYDILIKVKELKNGWTVCDIGEIKSKLPYACHEIAQVDYDQAQLYHYAATHSDRLRIKRIKIRAIRIIYKDRALETDDIHFGWLVKPDYDRQMDIMKYFQYLKEVVIDRKFLAPHPFEKSSKKCEYCRFKGWCWLEYPELMADEVKEIPGDKIEIPVKEILDSYAKKLYQIMKKEKELKEEKEKISPVIMAYLAKVKKSVYRLNDELGFEIRKSRDILWDKEMLFKKCGAIYFCKIADIKSALVSKLIKDEFVDAGIFEKAKKYKWKKAYLALTKLGKKT